MKLNKRVEFGIRAVEELYNVDGYIKTADLAKMVGTTTTFLEQILNGLKNAKIIEVKRGRNGGCKLTDRPTVFNAYEVATAVGFDVEFEFKGSNALGMLMDNFEAAWKNALIYPEECLESKKVASNE